MVILVFRQVTRFSKMTNLTTRRKLYHNLWNKKRNTTSVKLGMCRTNHRKNLRVPKNIVHLTNDMQVMTRPTGKTAGATFVDTQLAAQVIPLATLSLVASLANLNTTARYQFRGTTSEVPLVEATATATPPTQLPGSLVNERNSVLR